MVTITCQAGRIQEARICLTPGLDLRVCGDDARHDCALSRALMAPVR